MKQIIALVAALSAALCHAQAAPPAAVSPTDLRQVIVQKPVPASSPAPRQLSAQERAELRRQLSQYSRTGGKGS